MSDEFAKIMGDVNNFCMTHCRQAPQLRLIWSCQTTDTYADVALGVIRELDRHALSSPEGVGYNFNINKFTYMGVRNRIIHLRPWGSLRDGRVVV